MPVPPPVMRTVFPAVESSGRVGETPGYGVWWYFLVNCNIVSSTRGKGLSVDAVWSLCSLSRRPGLYNRGIQQGCVGQRRNVDQDTPVAFYILSTFVPVAVRRQHVQR